MTAGRMAERAEFWVEKAETGKAHRRRVPTAHPCKRLSDKVIDHRCEGGRVRVSCIGSGLRCAQWH